MKIRLLLVLSFFVFQCSFANTITAVDPVAPSLQPLTYCDPNNDGFGTFDFADLDYVILAAQSSAASNYVVGYYSTPTDAQTGANPLTSPYYNINPNTQTIYYRVTNINTNAFAFGSFQLVVNPTPVATNPPDILMCDDYNDGLEAFDFTPLITQILGVINPSTATVSFHTSQADANAASLPIVPINSYVAANGTVIWARVTLNATGCYDVVSFHLNVISAPIQVVLTSLRVCDGDSNPQDGSTAIDLTQQTPVILSVQPLAASNYSVTYYTSFATAQSGASPIITVGNYFGSNGQTIWYRLENNSTGCYNVGSFQLVVNTPLALTTPTPLSVCDSDASPNNQYTTFDLTVKNNEITQGLTGYTVTYFPSLSGAETGTNAITNEASYINVMPAIQNIGVIVTSPSGCSSLTTLDIRVLPVPTPNTNPPALAPQCDVNFTGDMMEMFDLTVNASYIVNGNPNLTLHYFATMADAQFNMNEILTPSAALVGSNVWIRVENSYADYQGHHCYVLVEQPLTVNPLPTIIQPLAPYRVCDDNADGIATFDLANPLLALMILGPNQMQGSFGISYYATPTNAASGIAPLPSTYLNVTPYSQTIYIRVVNNATGCVNAQGQLTLVVENHATASGPQNFATCDNYGNPNDGEVAVDLTQYASSILNGQNPATYQISYYTTQANAINGSNPISIASAQAYETGSTSVWVKVTNSSGCYALTTINISVEPNPNPIITTQNGFNTVYVDASHNVVQSLLLDSGVTGNYSYQWYLNGSLIAGATNSTYLVDTATLNNESRSYSVSVESNTILACSLSSVAFVVLQSNDVPPPTGLVLQSFPPGATLANIVVSGANVQWYASATNKMVTSTPLPLITPLVDGTTYYATQTVNGIESVARLPVTVHVTLGVNDNEIFPIRFAPNPVKDTLTLQSSVVLKSVTVYTMLGQKVFEQKVDGTAITIDLSRLTTGNYIVKVQGETGQKTLRIIKE